MTLSMYKGLENANKIWPLKILVSRFSRIGIKDKSCDLALIVLIRFTAFRLTHVSFSGAAPLFHQLISIFGSQFIFIVWTDSFWKETQSWQSWTKFFVLKLIDAHSCHSRGHVEKYNFPNLDKLVELCGAYPSKGEKPKYHLFVAL